MGLDLGPGPRLACDCGQGCLVEFFLNGVFVFDERSTFFRDRCNLIVDQERHVFVCV